MHNIFASDVVVVVSVYPVLEWFVICVKHL